MKQVHFRVEEELWEKFRKIFPYKGEPSAFFKRCIVRAIEGRLKAYTPEEDEWKNLN